jgi:dihydrofolate reductase
MNINIIAAMSKNRVIGVNGKLPWNIPKDLKYFKEKTSGKNTALIMGSNTWKSLPTYPEPLPNRISWVVTKNNIYNTRAMIIKDLENFDISRMQKIYDNIWICGGQSIYEYYIDKPYINKLYLTEIDEVYNGDSFFPKIPNHFSLEKTVKINTYPINALQFGKYKFNIYKNNDYKS